MNKETEEENLMKKKLLSFAVLSWFILFAQTSIVSAQLPNFNLYFNSVVYELGSTGLVITDIQTFDVPFEISRIGITLYFPITDGTVFETEFVGENYGETPLQIPADNKTSVPISFKIPERTDLKSGRFSYFFEVDIRPQNTTTYSHETYGPEEATAFGEYCFVYNPEGIPSPDPTSEPTPTPVPTNPTSTPTSTPTITPENTDGNQPEDTIMLTATEVALIVTIIIAVVFGIIAVWALKRK